MHNSSTVNDSKDTPDEGVDFQDLALAFLTKGIEALKQIYLDYAIPPAMSMELWSYLHSKKATSQELALWMINVHVPMPTKPTA